jgi:hypothetical protein
VLATSVDADTIYAVPTRDRRRGGRVAKLCDALGDCTPRSAGARRRARQPRAFAYVRRQVARQARASRR